MSRPWGRLGISEGRGLWALHKELQDLPGPQVCMFHMLQPLLSSHAASSYKAPDSWAFSNAAPQGAGPSLEMVFKAESRKKLSRQESGAEAKDLVKGRPRDGTGVGRGLCLQSTVRRGGSRARGDGQCQSRGKNENKQNHWTEDCSWWIWREVLVADGRGNMLIKVSGGKDVEGLVVGLPLPPPPRNLP